MYFAGVLLTVVYFAEIISVSINGFAVWYHAVRMLNAMGRRTGAVSAVEISVVKTIHSAIHIADTTQTAPMHPMDAFFATHNGMHVSLPCLTVEQVVQPTTIAWELEMDVPLATYNRNAALKACRKVEAPVIPIKIVSEHPMVVCIAFQGNAALSALHQSHIVEQAVLVMVIVRELPMVASNVEIQVANCQNKEPQKIASVTRMDWSIHFRV